MTRYDDQNQSHLLQLYFSTESDDQFVAAYPTLHIPPEFKPHTRPWYIQNKESYLETQKNTFVVTKPYIDGITSQIIITITKSLVNS